MLAALHPTSIYVPVAMLLATELRRDELMGLHWDDIDFDARRLRVEREVERTSKNGLL